MTIFPQLATDVLGLGPRQVERRMGDAAEAPPTAAAASVLVAPCGTRLARSATSSHGFSNLLPGTPVAEAMRRAGGPEISADGRRHDLGLGMAAMEASVH